MNGLLRRLTRRRAATADETPPGTPAASEPVDATVVSLEERSPLSEEERAREDELRRRRRDLPAGVDPDRLETIAGESARRGALRRRVRYLRSAREVLMRDLGGFYYEVHRAAGAPHGGHRELLESKAGRLAAIDEELGQLDARLGETRQVETVVREPGVGGTCPTCGELHGSDAGWCANCGTPLSDRARERHEQDVDRTIAARQAEAAERSHEAERARKAAAASPAASGATAGGTTAGRSSTDETATGGSSTDETATGGSPTDETAAGGSSTDETATGGSPTEETAAGGSSADGAPAGDAPTRELAAADDDADPVTAPAERRS